MLLVRLWLRRVLAAGRGLVNRDGERVLDRHLLDCVVGAYRSGGCVAESAERDERSENERRYRAGKRQPRPGPGRSASTAHDLPGEALDELVPRLRSRAPQLRIELGSTVEPASSALVVPPAA